MVTTIYLEVWGQSVHVREVRAINVDFNQKNKTEYKIKINLKKKRKSLVLIKTIR